MKAEELAERYKNGQRDFRQISLEGENLAWSTLNDADFRGANLQHVNLKSAELHRVKFSEGTNLAFADLGGAELINTDLRGCNLQGANLSEIKLNAIIDEHTKLPKGFHARLYGDHELNFLENYEKQLKKLESDKIRLKEKLESEQTQSKIIADQLQGKIYNLEKKLRDSEKDILKRKGEESSKAKAAEKSKDSIENSKLESSESKQSNAALKFASRIDLENLIDNKAKLVVWECGQVLRIHKSSITALAISSESQLLASGSSDRELHLNDLSSGRYLCSFFGQSREITSVAISPDSQTIASGCFDKKITAWRLKSRKLLRTFMKSGTAVSHNGPVFALIFTPCGQKLVSGGADKTMKIWNVQTGSLMKTLSGHADAVTTIAVSPNGKVLLSGSTDQNIGLWDLASDKRRFLKDHQAWIYGLAISPDGRIFVSASTDGILKIWNSSTESAIHSINAHAPGLISVAVSPDGQTLASGSGGDNTVKLWNLLTGQLLDSLEGCHPVIFAPDGKTLVCVGPDNTIKIWQKTA